MSDPRFTMSDSRSDSNSSSESLSRSDPRSESNHPDRGGISDLRCESEQSDKMDQGSWT